MKNNSFRTIGALIGLIIAILFAFSYDAGIKSYAGDTKYYPTRVIYENGDTFSMTKNAVVSDVTYGKNIGTFYIKGAITRESNYKETQAYAASGDVTFGYSCNPEEYEITDHGRWMYWGSDAKTAGDIKLSKKIGDGTIVIQKSNDGKTWVDACDPVRNVFSDKKINLSEIYKTTDSDRKNGTYYRVVVLYELFREVNPHEGWFGKTDYDIEVKCCAEEHIFYITYAENPLIIYNLKDRSRLSDNASVEEGFFIDLNGANASVSVKKDNGTQQTAKSKDNFVQPGTYTISITSPLGDSFTNTVTVKGGLSTYNVNGKKYENPEKSGYVQQNEVASAAITSLKVTQKSGTTIKTGTVNNYQAYGITGNEVNLFMALKSNKEVKSTGWEIVSDEWGKKDKQNIADVHTGTMGSGALIVQKSSDGKNWKQIENERYASGLHTTDYGNNYAGLGDVLVYSPAGKDVLNGVYIRVWYAYEIKKIDGKEKKRCLEKYEFYLCSDELDSITFHNLSAEGKVDEIYGEDSNIDLQMYKTAETMDTGAVTVTGFTIDTSLNPTVKYTVKKNGEVIESSKNQEYKETGRYDIRLNSAVGSTKDVTLYVDAMSKDECMKTYFGNGFIDGKRIYDKTVKYPVYEGGKTKYSFLKVNDNYQPLYGTIENLRTKKQEEISASRTAKTSTLTEPGEYVVTLSNNPTYKTNSPSGDNKTIMFHFYIIEEGTAPGPQCNYESLAEWERKSISGIHHIYYGISFRSLGNRRFTEVFATKEDAVLFAYEREGGTVEKQSDGSYLYASAEDSTHKKKYDSLWELTEAYQQSADATIEKLYIDPSSIDTYITLDPKEKTDDLEALHLEQSIMVFPKGKGQREKMEIEDALPIINNKPYAYQNDGGKVKTEPEYEPFKFVKDKYGADSYSVKITDASGKEFPIAYGTSVADQLEKQGCATGKVTITEETIYGDARSYEAVYFAKGTNTARVEVSYFEGEQEKTAVLSQDDAGIVINADAFSIKDIQDQLDPYNMVIIWNKDEQGVIPDAYEAGQEIPETWSNDGEYEVTVVNRIGNKYSFTIDIENSVYTTISFKGQGTDNFQKILAKRGDKDVKLPIPKREGYEFAGYSDEEGTIYEDVISQITFNGNKILSPTWRVKKNSILFEDEDGKVIDTLEVEYGAIIDLPVPETSEDIKFEGWMKDGKLIMDSTFEVTEDTDLVLVAKYSEIEKQSNVQNDHLEETGNQQKMDDKEEQDNASGGSAAPIVIIVMLLAAVGGGAFYYKKKHS
ncbi:InlB B-repeat-containing protein [Butyrivibrio sp. VCB2006]|uniref:InlB B-repeat-containing protein n=1 Tax=Butyrivibrio sp. VCB2006 TaxID=1280679 RepID=UPI00041C0F15|nr:InlB B-repeat-containing protein [Butyrivibrio sp. VCB2006]